MQVMSRLFFFLGNEQRVADNVTSVTRFASSNLHDALAFYQTETIGQWMRQFVGEEEDR